MTVLAWSAFNNHCECVDFIATSYPHMMRMVNILMYIDGASPVIIAERFSRVGHYCTLLVLFLLKKIQAPFE